MIPLIFIDLKMINYNTLINISAKLALVHVISSSVKMAITSTLSVNFLVKSMSLNLTKTLGTLKILLLIRQFPLILLTITELLPYILVKMANMFTLPTGDIIQLLSSKLTTIILWAWFNVYPLLVTSLVILIGIKISATSLSLIKIQIMLLFTQETLVLVA